MNFWATLGKIVLSTVISTLAAKAAEEAAKWARSST